MKHLSVLSLAVLTLAACGRSNTIYHDAGDGVVSIDAHPYLPTEFKNESVNNALVDSSGTAARFQLNGGTSAAGAFNDSTLTGNRAILGIQSFDQSPLQNFSLSLEDTSTTASQLHVSLNVDLHCDGTHVRTVSSSDLANGSAAVGLSDSVWSAPGGDIQDSSSAIVVSENTNSSLNALIAAYPSACLVNGVSDDPTAPMNVSIGAIALSIGNGSSSSTGELSIQSLTVNGQTFNSWSAQ